MIPSLTPRNIAAAIALGMAIGALCAELSHKLRYHAFIRYNSAP